MNKNNAISLGVLGVALAVIIVAGLLQTPKDTDKITWLTDEERAQEEYSYNYDGFQNSFPVADAQINPNDANNPQKQARLAVVTEDSKDEPKTSTDSLSYAAALAIYQKNGYRFQFDDCHGMPGKMYIREGVKFMLDNRDPIAHTIKIKTQTFHIPAYGFVIATAKDVGKYNILCDGGDAAWMYVEKK